MRFKLSFQNFKNVCYPSPHGLSHPLRILPTPKCTNVLKTKHFGNAEVS